jgi:hypothetical protein
LVLKPSLSLADRFDQKVFDAIYARSLVYNTCWEDPAVDLAALERAPDDRMLVITSARCNALDYALAGPGHIHAVDANPRQNASWQASAGPTSPTSSPSSETDGTAGSSATRASRARSGHVGSVTTACGSRPSICRHCARRSTRSNASNGMRRSHSCRDSRPRTTFS